MKTKLYFLFILSLPFLMACGDDNMPELKKEEKRTLLVYMAADNSLAKFVAEDLQEMKDGFLAMPDTRGMHLLVYVDTGSSPRLIELEKQGNQVVENIVQQYENRNSCGVEETQEVFDDAFGNSKYEAGSYGLVYWSHGDGWIPAGTSTRWIGQDKGGNISRYMDIDDFVSILKTAPHFDFVMFDACYMQSIEVAYALREYTDYYIGSPAENPGPGAPYDKIMPYMFQPGAAVSLATVYFNYYEEKYNGGMGISNNNWTGGTAINVLRTSELELLAQVTKSTLSGVVADKEILRSSVFDYDQRYDNSHIGYYDLSGIMKMLVSDETAFTKWNAAYQQACCYWATTPKIYSMISMMFSMEGTMGVTHYVPTDIESEATRAYRQTAWYQAAGLSAIGF